MLVDKYGGILPKFQILFSMGNVEHYWEGNAYPDTTLTFGRNCVEYPIKPNGMTYEVFYDRTIEEWFLILPKDTMSVYFFNYDTLQHYSWETIRREYKILQRYDLSIEDLHLLDDNIVYPPSEAMKNMKMYPPYKRK